MQVEDGMFLPFRSLHLGMLSNKVATSTQPNKQSGMVSERGKKKKKRYKLTKQEQKSPNRCH